MLKTKIVLIVISALLIISYSSCKKENFYIDDSDKQEDSIHLTDYWKLTSVTGYDFYYFIEDERTTVYDWLSCDILKDTLFFHSDSTYSLDIEFDFLYKNTSSGEVSSEQLSINQIGNLHIIYADSLLYLKGPNDLGGFSSKLIKYTNEELKIERTFWWNNDANSDYAWGNEGRFILTFTKQ